MRRLIIFVMLLIFNFLFIYGINYANKVMKKNDFMIYLREQEIVNTEEEETPEEEIISSTDFNGESVEQISIKFENVFHETLLQGYGEYMVKRALSKGVNPYLVGGIILESTNCRIECSILLMHCNNVSGIRDKSGSGCFGGTYKYYDSIDKGIDDLIKKISNDYPTNEEQIPDKMFTKYGRDSIWAFKVNRYIEDLRRGR